MPETNGKEIGKEKIIEMKNLKKYFPMKKRQVLKAVDNVTMDIYKGEVLSLVGESGSGKTTLGRTVSRLYPKTAGDILVDGKPAESYSIKEFTKKIQMIFQDLLPRPLQFLSSVSVLLKIHAEICWHAPC